jgi:hypothetical protein
MISIEAISFSGNNNRNQAVTFSMQANNQTKAINHKVCKDKSLDQKLK